MPRGRKQIGPDDPYLSVLAASKTLGESRHSVLARAVRGELETELVAGRTVVTKKSVARLLAAREKQVA